MAEVAAAARRVNRAIANRRPSDETVLAAARQLNDVAARLEAGQPRVKLDDMLSRPHLREIYSGEHFPLPLDAGDEIEFDPFSIAGGALHPASVGVTFTKQSDDEVSGISVVDPMFAGPPERTHGGALALIFDELMGALNRMRGHQAFTARLEINYRAPTPLNAPLSLRTWVHQIEGRKVTLHATCHAAAGEAQQPPDEAVLCADAEGLFIVRQDEG